MHLVEHVKIEKFWGDRTVETELHPQLNFFIGKNGTGKTTFINIIAAALSADFATLDRLPFSTVELRLIEKSSRKKSRVKVSKIDSKSRPFAEIRFEIKDGRSGADFDFRLDEIESQFSYRDPRAIRTMRSRRDSPSIGVLEALSSLVATTWLSIHRATLRKSREDDNSYESSVDKRLDAISTSIAKYQALLNSRLQQDYRQFQESIFLSLLDSGQFQLALDSDNVLDLSAEKNALNSIFERFQLDRSRYRQKLDTFFSGAEKAFTYRAEKSAKDGVRVDDALTILTVHRVHSIVQAWNDLEKRKKEIFKGVDTFVEILNILIERKELLINERSEIVARTDSGKILQAKELSSGEKQLLIVLGEALLQEGRPHIYIADEPELSLHIEWQKELITSLRRLNPQMQVIVATHSPDIVGSNYPRSIDMERLLA